MLDYKVFESTNHVVLISLLFELNTVLTLGLVGQSHDSCTVMCILCPQQASPINHHTFSVESEWPQSPQQSDLDSHYQLMELTHEMNQLPTEWAS